MDVFGLRKEAGVPADNPHRHWEDIQTPHRKDSGPWGFEPLTCCEVIVITKKEKKKLCYTNYVLWCVQII